MAEQSKSTTAPREPALRPKGMKAPGLDAVRNARVFADGNNLVVRNRRGRERRYPVGDGGIRQAVFFPPADIWETTTKWPTARWGVVVFQDAEGRYVLRVPLAQWLPEAASTGTADLSPQDCLSRTGIKQLSDRLGIPLSESAKPWGREVIGSPGGGRYESASEADLPVWNGWARGIGMFGWLIALVVSFTLEGTGSWGLVVAAGALFLLPASDVVVRALAWWRKRGDTRLADAVVITPSPEPGAGATRRFLETAAVRVLPGDVVLTNTLGEERWYARRGAHGIARLVRLTHPKTGAHLGVELRDGAGQARALLPWRYWFAGPDGERRWSELVAALELPVSEEKFKPAGNVGRRTGTPELWYRAHELAGDARKMAPIDSKAARRATSWNESVIGGGEVIVLPMFSALLLVGLFSDRAPGQAAGVLSALTIVAVWGPAVAHQLASRLTQDRPCVSETS
uniref:Integral membrane protein n=1 Tax=Streptomyces sp. NBC_00093 TaxID=2975649 RepID=A0AAU2A185_9ACTN